MTRFYRLHIYVVHNKIVCNTIQEGFIMNTLYTATALATGDGRNGHARSDDGILDLDLRMPKELGGAGGAANPEMLFALGYAACFHSALKLVAGQGKLDVTDSVVSA